MDKRQHNRVALQQSARSTVLKEEVVSVVSRLNLKPVITNLSYGGMRLLFVPSLNKDIISIFKAGKSNLYFEFFLPPSIKKLQVTGKIKWVKERSTQFGNFSLIGVEFVTKTQKFYREIEKFLNSPSPNSEMYKNKRFFPRIHSDISTDLGIQGLKKLGFLPKYYKCNMINISAVGNKLKLVPPLKAKEITALKSNAGKVTVKFFLPGANKNYTLSGKVVYIKNITKVKEPHSLLGVKFINLNEKEREAIIEFVCLKRVVFLKAEIDSMEKVNLIS